MLEDPRIIPEREDFSSVRLAILYLTSKLGTRLAQLKKALDKLVPDKHYIPRVFIPEQTRQRSTQLVNDWVEIANASIRMTGAIPLQFDSDVAEFLLCISIIDSYDRVALAADSPPRALQNTLHDFNEAWKSLSAKLPDYRQALLQERFSQGDLPTFNESLFGISVGGDGQGKGSGVFSCTVSPEKIWDITNASDDSVKYVIMDTSQSLVEPCSSDHPSATEMRVERAAYLNTLRHLRATARGDPPAETVSDAASAALSSLEAQSFLSSPTLAFSTADRTGKGLRRYLIAPRTRADLLQSLKASRREVDSDAEFQSARAIHPSDWSAISNWTDDIRRSEFYDDECLDEQKP